MAGSTGAGERLDGFDGVIGREGLKPAASRDDRRPGRKAWQSAWRRACWGLEPSSELAAVTLGYFAQGVKTQMAIMAEQYLMKDLYHQSPAQTQVWLEVAKAPWVIKPLFGFVTDSAPICGERRRPYLVLCGSVAAVAYLCLGTLAASVPAAVACMLAAEAAIAFSDVVVDGVVVERSRAAPQEVAGALQSVCWGSQAVGSLASAWTGGWLVGRFGPRWVLRLMALFPLLVSGAGLLVREEGGLGREGSKAPGSEDEAEGLVDGRLQAQGAAPRPSVGSQLRTLAAALLSLQILLPATFSFLWTAYPDLATALFYFYTNALHFSAEFLGRVALLDGAAQLAGVLLFNLCLRSAPLRRVFLWVCLACAAAGFAQLLLVTGANHALGIGDKALAALGSVLVDAFNRLALMPVLVLSARLCPPDVEATLYATLMAIQNAGAGAGRLQGALLTSLFGVTASDFAGLPWLVFTASCARLLPLLFLWLLPCQSAAGPPIEPA